MFRKKILALIFCIAFCVVQSCSANELLASTATENSEWSLSILKTDDGEYAFRILNHWTNQAGIVPYTRDAYNFYLNGSPVIFLIAVKNSPHDVDVDFGEWHGDLHLLPVYALFNYSNGQVYLKNYLSSFSGLSSSNYHGKLESPYHIKLAEIFLTHMPALHKAVESEGIKLP